MSDFRAATRDEKKPDSLTVKQNEGMEKKEMTTIDSVEAFRTWFVNHGLDANDDFNEIYSLYEMLESNSGEQVVFTLNNSDVEPLSIVKSIIPSLMQFLDGLYPEGGGVHGEDTRRNNMEKD